MSLRAHPPQLRLGGRLLVLTLLLLALMPPPLPWTDSALDIVLVVDESASMSRESSERAWEQGRALLADAPANSQLQLVHFGAKPVLGKDMSPYPAATNTTRPRSEALDVTSTNIASALQQALRLMDPDMPTIMLLATDGGATHGDTDAALKTVKRAGVPVYLMATPEPRNGEFCELLDLQVPSRVSVGEQVSAVAIAKSKTGGTVELSLKIDGQVRERKILQCLPGTHSPVVFEFVAPVPGVKLVTVSVERDTSSDRNTMHTTLTRAVNVLGPASLLYITVQTGANPIVTSLQRGGRKTVTLSPAELMARPSKLQEAGIIVLDNLAIHDLSESAWETLVTAVQRDSKGLAVLGGARSFGAGAYRHSTLEDILPVTAEAPEPQDPAAVVFVLDRSGSMGRRQPGPSRLSLARQAIAGSIKHLLPDDYLGIIAFAATAEVRLPLATPQANTEKVLTALAVTPGGGTQLAPALQLAASQLRATDVGRRLLVLVTDGFADGENLQAIAGELRADAITVIALAVGRDPNRETLLQLTAFNEGRILSVTETATLPRLMRDAIAIERAPEIGAASVPLVAQPLPFPLGPVGAWPPLSAYMVSKARPTADVYLQSRHAEPLFASGLAGSGRVAVLPAGLTYWARAWWQWPQMGAFLGGLVHWLDPGYGADKLSLAVEEKQGELVFDIDLYTDGEWESTALPRLLLDDPVGTRTALAPALQAPGRYQARMAAYQAGLYHATVQASGQTLRHGYYRNANREFMAAAEAPAHTRRWLQQGWLKPWPDMEQLLAAGPRDTSGLRRLLLVLALLSYLLLLVMERGLIGTTVLWLRDRISR